MKEGREEQWMGLIYALSAAWLLHTLTQTLLAHVFAHYGMPQLRNYFSGDDVCDQEGRIAVRVSIAAVQLIAFGATGFAFLRIYFGANAWNSAFSTRIGIGNVAVAVAAVAIAQPMIQYTILTPETFVLPWTEWEKHLEKIEERNARLLENLLPHDLPMNLLVIAVMPAIMEEVFFRGYMLKTLTSLVGIHAAVWVGALLFAALHFQAFGFVGRTLLGALFGYLTVFSGGNLWPAVAAHFVNNAVYVASAYFLEIPESSSVRPHPALALASGVAVVWIVLKLKRKTNLKL
ncbi:MAG: CPBP family intramembrane metalloprotease [Bacteroidia bacterium]|nr:CPBP family intramembrane metalloprotease [Bacteroidia bacterium]